MENTNLHTLGIDIGSTTVKIAILNPKGELLFSDYERHYANIQETLAALLKKAYAKLGELTLAPMIRLRRTDSGKTSGRAFRSGSDRRVYRSPKLRSPDGRSH